MILLLFDPPFDGLFDKADGIVVVAVGLLDFLAVSLVLAIGLLFM